jgi:tetratricopeptide (TPR) repeat protein
MKAARPLLQPPSFMEIVMTTNILRAGAWRAARGFDMSDADARACPVTGATPAALQAYERALVAFLGWRGGTEEALAQALQQAPGFVMAHLLQGYLLVCGRDPRRVGLARPVLARAAALRANSREQRHLLALAAAIDGDYEAAKAHLGDVLDAHPRDALALHVAHAFDYVTGDVARLHDRVAAVLPAWSAELPGYHAVLAMHAFGLEECGEYERAEEAARDALAQNPANARAHHVMAHVFEMTDRAGEGLRWMNAHIQGWAVDSLVSTHCWWHLALFHLAQGEADRALALYDRRLSAAQADGIADLIDAAALLWRLQLESSTDPRARWPELAAAWSPRINDGFCSFNDVHAMLAFVGARDWQRALRLERALAAAQWLPTRHGETTRQLGLPACRALIAFGRGDDALATTLLASVPAHAHRLGGSHAQRDVLHLTLLKAIEHLRRPAHRLHAERTDRRPGLSFQQRAPQAQRSRPVVGFEQS